MNNETSGDGAPVRRIAETPDSPAGRDTSRMPSEEAVRDPRGATGPARPVRERMADLIGLLCLLAVTTLVYVATGPGAFAAVTAVGAGLFAGWQGRGDRD